MSNPRKPKTLHLQKTQVKRTPQTQSFRIGWIAIILLFISVAVCIWWFLTPRKTNQITAPSDEKYTFTDSKYAGIKSKFATRRSAKEITVIEYPITNIPGIDKTTSTVIDQADKDFRRSVAIGSSFLEPMTQTIGYQVSYNSDKFLSLTIQIQQDFHGAHPMAATHFWTFNKTSGEIVTLKKLLSDSDKAVEKAAAFARENAKEKLAAHRQPTDIDENITPEIIMNFVVQDKQTISFPFGRGIITPIAGSEPITISLKVGALKDYLQNPLAKAMLDVPEPPKHIAPPPVVVPGSCHKCVALTYDDGPSAYTPELLDILNRYQAKASFFVLGSKVSSQAALLKRMVQSGHDVGNHSWSHPDLSRLGASAIHEQLANTNSAITSATGKTPTLARPPYGATSPTVFAQLQSLGLSSIHWSVDTRDWADRNSQIVCNRAVGNTRPGAIILLHDIHKTSVDATPCIIETLQKQGYRLVSVSSLLGTTTPGQVYCAG